MSRPIFAKRSTLPRGPHFSHHDEAPFDTRGRFKVENVWRLCRKYRRGAAVVEFAVVVPLLLAMVLGIIEVGRLVMVQQILTNGSREGARIAIEDGVETLEVQALVGHYLQTTSVGNAAVTITPDRSTVSPTFKLRISFSEMGVFSLIIGHLLTLDCHRFSSERPACI